MHLRSFLAAVGTTALLVPVPAALAQRGGSHPAPAPPPPPPAVHFSAPAAAAAPRPAPIPIVPGTTGTPHDVLHAYNLGPNAGLNSGAPLIPRTGVTTGFSSTYNPTIRNNAPLIGAPNNYFPSQTTGLSTSPLFPYASAGYPYGRGPVSREPMDEYDNPTKFVVTEPAAPVSPYVATMNVFVPANAEIWFEGSKTGQRGPVRTFVSPPLESGQNFTYEVRARWKDNGKEVDQTQKVRVHAGERVDLKFEPKKPPEPTRP